MKKHFSFFAALLLLSVSCEKVGPMGPMGPQGPQGEAASFDIVIVNVPENSWKYSGLVDNNFFCATVDVPELTEEAFDYGIISMYRTYNYDKSDASQIALPYVRLNEELVGKDYVFYTETIDYEYGIGWVKIYYTVSDFIYEIDPSFNPQAMQFRLVIAN